MVRTYRDFIVWQKAIALVTQVYMATKDFPPTEVYGLTSQMRRADVSIPSNIAEGFARKTDGDFGRFLRMACGSVYELQTQLEIAGNLRYLTPDESQSLTDGLHEIEKMLSSFISKVTNRLEGS
jgi:four helix bundle protein